ncbi:MAG: hypothetical protein AB8B78_09810 [Polaribacter sp.]
MKIIKIVALSFFLIGISMPTNAQFWKKLKKKVQKKVEQKVDEKIDKETDKIIDSTLNGKAKKKEVVKKDARLKSYGSASISHSAIYGMFSVNDLTKTKLNKEGKKVSVKGYWRTSGADVFDGYILNISTVDDINALQNKTFKIPEEATLKLAYNALVKGEYVYKRGQIHAPQNLQVSSGSVTISFNKDNNVNINFSGNVKLNNHNNPSAPNTSSTINGMISTTAPEFTITKERKEQQKDAVDEMSEEEKMEVFKKMSPTVNIPSTFSFNKTIEVKMTDEKGDSQTVEFLTGSYPDIYALAVAPKEMQGQEMLIVNTPKSSSIFMNMGGMKIKKITSLEQMGSQYNMVENLPEDGDFKYKKTGKTKTIIGYLCEEVKVEYDYTNSKGSASFWLSKDFPIQNKAIPMLGMRMNNPNFSGFVLEMNTTQNGKKFTIEVTNISDKNVSINTNEYKKMGF